MRDLKLFDVFIVKNGEMRKPNELDERLAHFRLKQGKMINQYWLVEGVIEKFVSFSDTEKSTDLK